MSDRDIIYWSRNRLIRSMAFNTMTAVIIGIGSIWTEGYVYAGLMLLAFVFIFGAYRKVWELSRREKINK